MLAVSCSAEPPPPTCFLGDRSRAPELRLLMRTPAGDAVEITESSSVALIQPPQGGKVIFVGPKVRNIDGCPVDITTTLKDPCSGTIVALEKRPVVLTEADGWLIPERPQEISNYSKLGACPKAGISNNIVGEWYVLKLRLEDKSGLIAEASARVMPICSEPSLKDRCLCECDQQFYPLGGLCDPRLHLPGSHSSTCSD